MIVYMIRHGESEANRDHVHAGWMDTPLTEKGRAQAAHTAGKLAGIRFDRVWSSDLCRAMETARLALPGREPELLPVARERNVGTLAGKTREQCEAEYGESYRRAKAELDFTPFGGEDLPMHVGRARQVLEKLADTDCACAAVFTHGGFLRAVLDEVTGMVIPNASLEAPNCMVMILRYEKNVWKLVSWNAFPDPEHDTAF